MSKVNEITINLDVELAKMMKGIRRASAFLQLSLHGLDERIANDFDITSGFTFQVWPEKISLEDRRHLRNEYEAWAVASCFRELEQFFDVFLNRVGLVVELAAAHGTVSNEDRTFGASYSKQTNIAQKHNRIANEIGGASFFNELNSISLARNCMAHNLGIVRHGRDCNNKDRSQLSLQWLGIDVDLSRSGEITRVSEFPFDTTNLPGAGPIKVGAVITPRQTVFEAGSRIILNHTQLAELCFFFAIVTENMGRALQEHLSALNILLRRE